VRRFVVDSHRYHVVGASTLLENLTDRLRHALGATAVSLISDSLSPSTQATYNLALQHFSRFSLLTGHSSSPPFSTDSTILFIAFLHGRGFAPSSIGNQLLEGVHLTSSSLVTKALVGCRKLSPFSDPRLPITLDILHQLLQSLPRITSDPYLLLLLSAMFVLAFHPCLCIGEVTLYMPETSDDHHAALVIHAVLRMWHNLSPHMFVCVRVYCLGLGLGISARYFRFWGRGREDIFQIFAKRRKTPFF
jgi:hypothetical protein